MSAAPNTKPPADLLKEPAAAARAKLRLRYLDCGDQDNLLRITQGVHTMLDEKHIPHTCLIPGGRYDFAVWKTDLYHFAQRVFQLAGEGEGK